MTEEQIKSLKVGDKFTATFVVDETNNQYVHATFENGENYGGTCKENWDLLKYATLFTPPHTFEVDDTVRIVPDPMTGTVYGYASEFADRINGKIGTVLGRLANRGACHVAIGAFNYEINVHCLELVKKAVKNKYRVEETGCDWRITINENKCGFVAAWDKRNYPDAKAAAEAECARLNAEWRKQQEGGAE